MSYITSTDVTNAGGDSLLVLTCGDGAGGVNATVFLSILDDVQAEIDSILGPGFSVPFDSPIAKIIRRCAVDIAVYFCYERKPEFVRQDGDNPAFKRYQRAITILKEIRDGERDMGRETNNPRSAMTSTALFGSSPDHRFIIIDDESSGNTSGF